MVLNTSSMLPLKCVYASFLLPRFKEEYCPPESAEVTVMCALYKVCVYLQVCVCALSSCNSTAMLFWPNATHFMPWLDCSRYSFCTSERAEIICVFVCVSVRASRFAIVCLNVCCGAKCKMIARERREEIDVGAFWKPRETHTHTHKHTHTYSPISSGLLCSRDRLDTYCIFVCVFLCGCLEDKHQAPLANFSLYLYSIVSAHLFLQELSVRMYRCVSDLVQSWFSFIKEVGKKIKSLWNF